MNNSMPPFIVRFNKEIEEAEVLLSIVRDSDLQRAACKALERLLKEVETEKKIAIQSKVEDYANLLLGCECVARSIIAELQMWLLLKQENPDAAWDQLVNAQMAAVDAVRAHPGFHHLVQHNIKLEAIEHLVFPPQVFLSSGMLVRRQECSICGQEYGECEHLIGKPYMGAFCYIIARDLEIDHISIVEHPADKRCRVQEFDDEGGVRNRMTWRVNPKKNTPKK